MSFLLLLAGLTAESCNNSDAHIQIADDKNIPVNVTGIEKEKNSISNEVFLNISTSKERRLRFNKGE